MVSNTMFMSLDVRVVYQ